MTSKELRKLSRTELLEMLIEQGRENERLKQELDAANAVIADRKIKIEESGSIAEAALVLSGIFEDAQKAAELYLESVKAGHPLPDMAQKDAPVAEEKPSEPSKNAAKKTQPKKAKIRVKNHEKK